MGAPGAAGAPGAFGAPGAAGAPPGAAGAPGAGASVGRSFPHFLHLSFSGGLNVPHDGHFFIMSSNDGGLKHMVVPSFSDFFSLVLNEAFRKSK
ncbi:hypothetical protein C1879_12090 [Paraeggerthella hongkongensis]|nr:hypothetical protein C1879_12090 [Paraeggerthella hongkongensis]